MRRLLLIQDICLSWGKKERNSACAKKRTEFPVAYSLDTMPNVFHGEVLVNRLNFRQSGTVFQTSNGIANCFQSYPSVKDLNLSLKQGQYGHVIWNERKTDWDTGEWYYQLHALNLLYSDKMPEADIFLTGKPDFEYKQIAVLY